MGKSGQLERAQLANQIQGFSIPDRSDAWENNNYYYCPGVGPFSFLGLTLSWDNLGIYLELQLTLCFYLDNSSISATRPTSIT